MTKVNPPRLLWYVRELNRIVLGQSRNFRVLLYYNVVGSTLGGLVGAYLGMYPYDLGATVTEIGYLGSLSSLSSCFPVLLGGALAQKYGRKRIVLVTWPLSITSSIVAFAAPSWWFLIPATLIGSIASMGSPAWSALFADSIGDDKRASLNSLFSTLSGISGLFLPPLGGFLVEYMGGIQNANALRVFHGLYAAFYAFSFFYIWHFLEDDGKSHSRANENYGIFRGLGMVFKDGRIGRYLLYNLLDSVIAGLAGPFVTIYIFSEIKAIPTFIGTVTALYTALAYMFLNIGAVWSDRIGRKLPLVMSWIFYVFALLFLATAGSQETLMLYYVFIAISYVGVAAWSAQQQEYVPSDLRAPMFGIITFVRLISASLTPTLGGYLYSSIGPRNLFLIQASLSAFLATPYVILFIPETYQKRENA